MTESSIFASNPTTNAQSADATSNHDSPSYAQRAWNGVRAAAPYAASLGLGVATSMLVNRIESRLAK